MSMFGSKVLKYHPPVDISRYNVVDIVGTLLIIGLVSLILLLLRIPHYLWSGVRSLFCAAKKVQQKKSTGSSTVQRRGNKSKPQRTEYCSDPDWDELDDTPLIYHGSSRLNAKKNL